MGPGPKVGRDISSTCGGRTRSTAVLLLAVAAGLVAFLFFAGGERRGGVSARDGSTDVLSRAQQNVDELGHDALATVDSHLAGVRGVGFVGGASVRLRGPGQLVGTVLDRASGAGVDGCTVRLLTLPPVAADVAVEATKLVGMGGDFSVRVQPVATAETNAAGEFSFVGVKEGDWFLDAQAPHHLIDAPVQARVLASGAGGPVQLWMRAGGRIIGEVRGPGGEPVVDAAVSLTTGAMLFLQALSTGDVAMLRTRTGPDGRFSFPGVAPAEGYEIAAIGDGMTITHVLDITVRAGEDTEVLVLGRVGGTVRGRILSRGTDGDGELRPLAGAKVGALPRGLRHLKLAREILIATHAVTGEDGTYVLHGLPAGSADVLAIADGHVPGRGPLVHLSSGGVASARDFVLERGPMVRGIVVDSAGLPVQGARVLWNVIDMRSVERQPSVAPLFIAAMREFAFPETDSEGRFVAGPFTDRAPHTLRVTATGYETARQTWKPSTRGASIDGVLEPERLDEIVIELHRGGGIEGAAVDGTTGEPLTSFTVRVTQRIETDPAAPSRWNPFVGGTEVENEAGRFRLDSVAAGEQSLTVAAEGYLDGVAVALVIESEVTRGVVVSLRRGAIIRGVVVGPEGAPVAGAQVTTEALVKHFFERLEKNRRSVEDDLAVRGSRRRKRAPPVGLLRHAASLGLMGRGVTTTEPDGSFELSGLEAGPQEVLVFHRDYKPATIAVDLEEGDENEPIVVVMSEGGGLRGRVRDRFRQPVVDATVIAVSPGLAGRGKSNGSFHQARTNADGAYEMLHMEGGSYFLLSTRGDENLTLTSFLGTLNFSLVSVPRDRVVTHDLLDTSAGACRVHGLVLRDGAPVNGGMLLALNLDAEGLLGVDFKAAPIENDGRYEFEGLAPGEYQVKYEGQGGGGTVWIDVPDAPELRFDVELPDGTIRGRLIDRITGEPITDARLALTATDQIEGPGILAQLLAGEASVAHARPALDGSFRFKRLAEGTYRLSVESARRRTGERRIDYAPIKPVSVSVGIDEDVDIGDVGLDPGVTVEGVVRDDTGAPVEGADVVASPARLRRIRPRRATSDAEGRFVLTGLGPGGWQINASAEDHASGEPCAIEIEPGAERYSEDVELLLVEGVLVTVLVTDAGGQPLEGVTCVLQRVDGEGQTSVAAPGNPGDFFKRFFSGGAVTDGNGQMELGRHTEGRYELHANQGLRSALREVDLSGSGTQQVRITL